MNGMRLGMKAMLVLVLSLMILVPLTMIRGTIEERQHYRDEAIAKVSASYGGPQVLGGPVLVVPYEEQVALEATGSDGVVRNVVRRRTSHWTFFPETASVDGELKPGTRKVNLHQVRVYEWAGKSSARFDVQIPVDDGSGKRHIGQPWVSYGIADVVGLRGAPKVAINGKPVTVGQGLGHADGPGVHVRLLAPQAGSRLQLEARIEMTLQGTESFAMLPLAKQNEFRLHSTWPHPRFDGRSPQQEISARGFRANWRIAAVSSDAQRRYLQQPSLAAEPSGVAALARASDPLRTTHGHGDGVGVSLVDPVNAYVQADRATKYGLLFVMLTFVGFFMFELVKQVRVHPIQYLLVGLAIAIFFLLLVSLSEHVAFGLSYLLAAVACIGLIAFYLAAVLGSALRGLGFAAMLGTLYAALYGLLLSEDNALVMGAGLLFVILAAIMAATRKVDWYQRSGKPAGLAPPA